MHLFNLCECPLDVVADDVLTLGDCGNDAWFFHDFGDFSALTLGPTSNELFIACWETGSGWQGPYLADGEPLRKTMFPADTAAPLGCVWFKDET